MHRRSRSIHSGTPLRVHERDSLLISPAGDGAHYGFRFGVGLPVRFIQAIYQSGGAGVISLVSKSGTNAFHGDAFGVFRPDILAANEYFNKQFQSQNNLKNTAPSFHRYQYGGAIGGPILQNKLFFFGDYQGTREVRGVSQNQVVPSVLDKTGDLSDLADSLTGTVRGNDGDPNNFPAVLTQRLAAQAFNDHSGSFSKDNVTAAIVELSGLLKSAETSSGSGTSSGGGSSSSSGGGGSSPWARGAWRSARKLSSKRLLIALRV